MNKLHSSAFGILFLISFAIASNAGTFTFTATVGDWNTPENWEPEGPPGSADTAIIPNGKHCKVEAANQAALVIQVDSGGTLGVIGRQLDLGSVNGNTLSTINGTLYLDASGGGTPGKLACKGADLVDPEGTELGGSGTITARRDDGYGPGELVRFSASTEAGFTIDSGLTLVGSIHVKCSLNLWGLAKVDDADDTLTLGASLFITPRVGGIGEFRISAGLMSVLEANFNMSPGNPQPLWKLSGGEIDVGNVSDNSLFTDLTVPITITGGLLDINQTTSTSGEFTMSGGQLRVAVQGETFAASRP